MADVNPIQVIKNKWATLPVGCYNARINNGSVYGCCIQKLNNNYGSAIIYGYISMGALKTPIYVCLSNGVWSNYTFITNSDLGSNFCIINKNLKNSGSGRTICFNGNNIGGASSDSDSYYISVGNTGNMHIGYQPYGSKVVTWTDK